ncbi:MAG: hypothetical protein HYY23_14955 [Verrucomicrobia bacterium]|nr:hypothetical protein [Verrucomicrobiota bacterium]
MTPLSFDKEASIGPVGEILARPVAGIHRDQTDHFGAVRSFHVETPRWGQRTGKQGEFSR